MINNIVLLGGECSDEEVAEALAVQYAMLNMFCQHCRYYRNCSTDMNFKFPEEAECMKKKKEILKAGANNGEL